MTNAPQDPILFTFFNEIGIINQLTSTQMERLLPDGLRLAQFSVLNHFARLGGARTPQELAAAFQVTKGAMTNTLQRLEARGLVAIEQNPKDARSKLVTITHEGLAIREKAVAALAPALRELGAQLPLAKIEKVLALLQEVRKILDEARN